MARRITPSVQQLVDLFRDSLYYEIVHTFGIPAELTPAQLENHAIGECINFSRCAHGRALADFMYRLPVDAQKDDVVAADYGFLCTQHGGLSESDRQRRLTNTELNKRLLHITASRVNSRTPWSTQFLSDLLPITVSFVKHIRDCPNLAGQANLFTSQREQNDWCQLLECLERCQRGNRLRFKSGFYRMKTWYELSTESGPVASLYGTSPQAIPDIAAIIDSPTNTTSHTPIWTDFGQNFPPSD